ncbi:MAG TPA: hypothetical protein VEY33_00705 [Gemmatimonadota bacterium]|nr:hypothetical protein [Gemmatimonadota bacterium]
MTPKSARTAPPATVDAFAEALADWLSSFTVPQELAGEMASSCAAGAPWAAAIAGTSVRRVGWPEPEALAWGIAIGASAGALEAARRSFCAEIGARTADGPALPLLAADGLIAAAHEALASLEPERLVAGFDALGGTFGDGGPWKHLGPDWPRPAWPAVVACGLGPAAAEDPDGPWDTLAKAWRASFEVPEDAAVSRGASSAAEPDANLRNHPAADRDTNELFAAAANAARERDPGEDDDERF